MLANFKNVSSLEIGGNNIRFLAVREHDNAVLFPDSVLQVQRNSYSVKQLPYSSQIIQRNELPYKTELFVSLVTLFECFLKTFQPFKFIKGFKRYFPLNNYKVHTHTLIV